LVSSVLVAVDGSENSERALKFAADFAEKYNAQLTVVNVTEASAVSAVPYNLGSYSGDNMVTVAKDLHKYHEGILEKAEAKIKASNPNLPVKFMLRDGNPASEIIAVAKEGNFDVVIAGHRGLSKVREIFMGSISEKIVHTATCTVVIVK
jgi:nucleotide-binding universal stress UspA family protein